MAINLDKHRSALISAWKDVLNDKSDTNWALFGYEGQTNDLKFIGKGDGGLSELIDDLNGGKIMYAFLKVDVPCGSVSKYVLINWQGEGAPIVRKGTCANHVKHVAQFFPGFHLTMHARTEDDLDENVILDKLAKAGAAFNFKSLREEVTPSGPVGTMYKKVNPVQEINSSERDQFWMKEEAEEKRRVEAERKRKEEEKQRAQEDIRKRNEFDEAKRTSAEQEKKEAPPSPSRPSAPAGGAREAQQLIGGSVVLARAAFLNNNTSNNSSSNIPDKPVRSSVIAQRINTFTQQAQNNTPTSPIKTTKSPTKTNNASPFGVTLKPTNHNAAQSQDEPIKTSPIKNIDKIKMSLETPSQIQYDPILDPTDLSPGSDEPTSFSAINYSEDKNDYRSIENKSIDSEDRPIDKEISIVKEAEEMIKQNILDENLDASYSSGNEDDDSDNKFSTIKRSPYSKNNIAEANKELTRQDTVTENVHFKKEQNGNATHEDVSPEGMDEDGAIYEDLDEDPGLTARALYDYQAADDSEITFDPGDIITHIDQIDSGWWQGLGPHGNFGLFPANYVELLPAEPR